MADDSILALSNSLIAGRYAVDTTQALLDAGGGIPAYLARDRMASDGKRVALLVSRDASPNLRALRVLTEPVDNLMVPLGHGIAPLPGGNGEGYFVICTPAPGPPVSAEMNPWPDKPLIDLVLRPIARVLETLQERHLTHRAIRANNVFQSARGQPVTLGAAWAAPPAMHQPAIYESPYTAMCHPAGRGPGSIADDVYALGVLLLTLAGGCEPMANAEDGAVIRWKLELGSFGALTRDCPMGGMLGDLVHGMLSEDPDHRPTPTQLLDPGSLRGRRATARPPRRSQHPLMLSDLAVFDARMLAYALLIDQKKAIQFLSNGLVTQWLRRSLGDASLATQIEELVRERNGDPRAGPLGNPMLIMQTISAISARMPLCWRGIALWPDGLPGVLAHGVAGDAELMAATEELLVQDAVTPWVKAEARPGRPLAPDISGHANQVPGPYVLWRLFYVLNPMLPCRAAAMLTGWVADVPALMRFLERTAASAGETLIDLQVSAFISARADRKTEMQINNLATAKSADQFRTGELSLLRDLQVRYHAGPMPTLAKWAADRLRPNLNRWRNKPRRQALEARLDTVAQGGMLARLIEVTEDPNARIEDMTGAMQAELELRSINAEIAAIENEDQVRFADAERFGQAITGGIGLSVLILTVLSVLLR
jgi:hypothetical protein